MELTGERFIPDEMVGQIEVEHMQRYHSIMHIVEGKKILDAACGEGYGSALLAGASESVVGIDISDESIKWASEKYQLDNLKYMKANITSLPFEDESFDVVVSFETIEHVDELSQHLFLKEVKRVLRKDGIFIVSTPDKEIYTDIPKFENQFHVKEFYVEEFEEFLGKYFKNVDMYNQGEEKITAIAPVKKVPYISQNYSFLNLHNEPLLDRGRYLIAVCSEATILKEVSPHPYFTLSSRDKYISQLFVDFGGGYTEEVKVVAEMEIKNNKFVVDFKRLDPLDIKGLKWLPALDQSIELIITKATCNTSEIEIKQSSENNNILINSELTQYNVLYDVICQYNKLSFITIEGIIKQLPSKEINDRLIKNNISKINELVDAKESLVKENDLLYSQIANAEKQYTELDTCFKQSQSELIEMGNTLRRVESENDCLQMEISLCKKEEETLKQSIRSIEVENDSLSREISKYKNMLQSEKEKSTNLARTKDELQHALDSTNAQIHEILHSDSWKLTRPLRFVGRVSKQTLKKGVRFFFKGKNKEFVLKTAKKVYRRLPLRYDRKERIKDMVYSRFSFVLKDTPLFRAWEISKGRVPLTNAKPLVNRGIFEINDDIHLIQPGKIAIQLHLFYIDLIDEFIEYLSNMPFCFDLYVSITEREEKEFVSGKLSSIQCVERCVVEVVANRGRDVAPLVVTFADDLLKYDYICHLHTKKSLYTGNEQTLWRKHLLDNLIGSTLNIQKIFSLFSRYPELGILYPETVGFIPYWAHTWLENKGTGQELFNRMNIKPNDSNYLDYPAGTMFWARVEAIKPLLSLNLTIDDFPKENKQTDGTMAHAIERSLVEIVKSQNMGMIEINFDTNFYRLNNGGKNLSQYWSLNKNVLSDYLMNRDYEVVSFDIFDTLLTRPVLDPDAVFELVNLKIRRLLSINIDFLHLRKKSEVEARRYKDFLGDVSIDEIYDQFCDVANVTRDQSDFIKKLEINTEIELSTKRNDIVEVLKEVKDKGIKIVLISDMYMTKSSIQSLLDKNGITHYDDIWVSSETQKRKDTGEIWGVYKELFASSKTVHIGDNEASDIQKPTDLGLDNFHVMSGKNLFSNSQFGYDILNNFQGKLSLGDQVLFGLIVAKQFNNPFALHGSDGTFRIRDYKTLGYTIFGPVILRFFVWLVKKVGNEKQKVLFLAREGFLLKQIFDKFKISFKDRLSNVEGEYFLASRRAVSVPTIKNEQDILELIKGSFNGTVKSLLKSRFGIVNVLQEHDDEVNINLPEDLDRVQKIVLAYKDEILSNAAIEREYYINYLQQMNISDSDRISVIDLGYSGTIQYYLSKLLGKSTKGYYFATSDKQRGLDYQGNTLIGCFADKEEYLNTNSYVYKYHLILESILTSPKGQLIRFKDSDCTPQFGEQGYSQFNFNSLEEIHEGILEYIDEAIQYFNEELLEMDYSDQSIQYLLELIIKDNELLSENLKSIFVVEDNYCTSSEITAIGFYRKLFGA
ncbi:rhamnan synthesis F family protein [Paenibacillus alvei]|uniref:rhamnan synthesis F family protein n=1 Tax=Paenibacillus alvei TaxID=44250 RepID=UPI003D2CD0F0